MRTPFISADPSGLDMAFLNLPKGQPGIKGLGHMTRDQIGMTYLFHDAQRFEQFCPQAMSDDLQLRKEFNKLGDWTARDVARVFHEGGRDMPSLEDIESLAQPRSPIRNRWKRFKTDFQALQKVTLSESSTNKPKVRRNLFGNDEGAEPQLNRRKQSAAAANVLRSGQPKTYDDISSLSYRHHDFAKRKSEAMNINCGTSTAQNQKRRRRVETYPFDDQVFSRPDDATAMPHHERSRTSAHGSRDTVQPSHRQQYLAECGEAQTRYKHTQADDPDLPFPTNCPERPTPESRSVSPAAHSTNIVSTSQRGNAYPRRISIAASGAAVPNTATSGASSEPATSQVRPHAQRATHLSLNALPKLPPMLGLNEMEDFDLEWVLPEYHEHMTEDRALKLMKGVRKILKEARGVDSKRRAQSHT